MREARDTPEFSRTPPPPLLIMDHDLSYLRTEYARQKDLECYRVEEKEREAKQQEKENANRDDFQSSAPS